jgi:hypothetical protein
MANCLSCLHCFQDACEARLLLANFLGHFIYLVAGPVAPSLTNLSNEVAKYRSLSYTQSTQAAYKTHLKTYHLFLLLLRLQSHAWQSGVSLSSR